MALKTIFDHDFKNMATLDPAIWKIEDRDADEWGTKETGLPRKGDVNLIPGIGLALSATRFSNPLNKPDTQHYYTHSVGRITTKGRLDFHYGKVVIRARWVPMPSMWVSGWLRGPNPWATGGEIDGFEQWGITKNIPYQTIHLLKGTVVNKTEPKSVAAPWNLDPTVAHDYEFGVNENYAWVGIDGALRKTVTASGLPSWQTWPYTTAHKRHIICDIGVGGKAGAVGSGTPNFYQAIYERVTYFSYDDAPLLPPPDPEPTPELSVIKLEQAKALAQEIIDL